MTTINAATIAALSAAFSDAAAKAAKEELAPGSTTTVDCTVRIQGTLTKAQEGVEVADSTALPWSSVLALAIHRSGMHADKLRELCADVLAGNLTPEEQAAVQRGAAQWADTVKPMLPKRTNNPAVKAKVVVTPVG